jgi:hypothetical protein
MTNDVNEPRHSIDENDVINGENVMYAGLVARMESSAGQELPSGARNPGSGLCTNLAAGVCGAAVPDFGASRARRATPLHSGYKSVIYDAIRHLWRISMT